jgi:hypothetical protein
LKASLGRFYWETGIGGNDPVNNPGKNGNPDNGGVFSKQRVQGAKRKF